MQRVELGVTSSPYTISSWFEAPIAPLPTIPYTMSSTTYKQDLVYESINIRMSMGEMVMILLYICMQPNGISFGYGGNFGYVMPPAFTPWHPRWCAHMKVDQGLSQEFLSHP